MKREEITPADLYKYFFKTKLSNKNNIIPSKKAS
jgi:hypothetical protein